MDNKCDCSNTYILKKIIDRLQKYTDDKMSEAHLTIEDIRELLQITDQNSSARMPEGHG